MRGIAILVPSVSWRACTDSRVRRLRKLGQAVDAGLLRMGADQQQSKVGGTLQEGLWTVASLKPRLHTSLFTFCFSRTGRICHDLSHDSILCFSFFAGFLEDHLCWHQIDKHYWRAEENGWSHGVHACSSGSRSLGEQVRRDKRIG